MSDHPVPHKAESLDPTELQDCQRHPAEDSRHPWQKPTFEEVDYAVTEASGRGVGGDVLYS